MYRTVQQIVIGAALLVPLWLSAQAAHMGSYRYSVATHNAFALHGINVASINAHVSPSINIASLNTLHLSGEMGDMDFVTDIESLIDQLDQEYLSLDQADSIIEQFDGVLTDIGQQGYVTFALASEMPLALSYKRQHDAFSVTSRMYAITHISILDDSLSYNPLQETLETNTSAYVKVAKMSEFSLGYSKSLVQLKQGNLHIGARVNLQQFELSKQVINLNTLTSDTDLLTTLVDDYQMFNQSNTKLSLDISGYWATDSYNIGFTIANINRPEFSYGQLGQNCTDMALSISRDNCFSAQYFNDRIDLTETYQATPYATLQANVISDSHDASVDVSLQSPHITVMGQRAQWMTLSVAKQSNVVIFPNTRLTYAKNFLGQQLQYVSGEFNWGWLAVGLGYSLDQTMVDGEAISRGMFANVSISTHF